MFSAGYSCLMKNIHQIRPAVLCHVTQAAALCVSVTQDMRFTEAPASLLRKGTSFVFLLFCFFSESSDSEERTSLTFTFNHTPVPKRLQLTFPQGVNRLHTEFNSDMTVKGMSAQSSCFLFVHTSAVSFTGDESFFHL